MVQHREDTPIRDIKVNAVEGKEVDVIMEGVATKVALNAEVVNNMDAEMRTISKQPCHHHQHQPLGWAPRPPYI